MRSLSACFMSGGPDWLFSLMLGAALAAVFAPALRPHG